MTCMCVCLERLEQAETRAHRCSYHDLLGQPSEFGRDTSARVESDVQHATHPSDNHERHDRLVHESARCRPESASRSHPRRLAGPQGPQYALEWTTVDIQYRFGLSRCSSWLSKARQVALRSHSRSWRNFLLYLIFILLYKTHAKLILGRFRSIWILSH